MEIVEHSVMLSIDMQFKPNEGKLQFLTRCPNGLNHGGYSGFWMRAKR